MTHILSEDLLNEIDKYFDTHKFKPLSLVLNRGKVFEKFNCAVRLKEFLTKYYSDKYFKLCRLDNYKIIKEPLMHYKLIINTSAYYYIASKDLSEREKDFL